MGGRQSSQPVQTLRQAGIDQCFESRGRAEVVPPRTSPGESARLLPRFTESLCLASSRSNDATPVSGWADSASTSRRSTRRGQRVGPPRRLIAPCVMGLPTRGIGWGAHLGRRRRSASRATVKSSVGYGLPHDGQWSQPSVRVSPQTGHRVRSSLIDRTYRWGRTTSFDSLRL